MTDPANTARFDSRPTRATNGPRHHAVPVRASRFRPPARSDEFRQHWAGHDVRFHLSGVKRYHHRDVGDLELNYERLDVAFDSGLTIITYTADRGSRSAEALALLGTLAATATSAP